MGWLWTKINTITVNPTNTSYMLSSFISPAEKPSTGFFVKSKEMPFKCKERKRMCYPVRAVRARKRMCVSMCIDSIIEKTIAYLSAVFVAVMSLVH